MASISKILQLVWVRVFGSVLIVFAGLAAVNGFQLGQTLENQAMDLCYRCRPASAPSKDLVIVGIDEQSFQELQRSWPWPRRFHADLIRQLNAAGAKLIVFDVIFAEPSDLEDDQLFAEAIRAAGNVILASTVEVSETSRISQQILVQPCAAFRRAAKGTGLTLVTPDGDGIVRRFYLHPSDEITLPEIVARNYRPDLRLPPNLAGLIHFSGPPGHIYTVSYSRVLEGPDPMLAARLRGKIVLIGRILGASPTPQADAFYTPFFSSSGQLMSGVEIHGQVIQTLLNRNWGEELRLLPRLGVILAILLLFGFFLVRVSPFSGVIVLAGFVLLTFGLSFFLFMRHNLWLPPVFLSGGLAVIYAGHIFAHYWLESREKKWLRQAFGQYVSDSLVEAIIASPERLQLGGEEVEVTVLFSDLVDFSAIAENTAPKELIRLLNEYFSAMTEIILAHQGMVDKFIGDAIMAFWGAPLPLTDHAVQACKAALEMQRAMGPLKAAWRAQGFPAVSSRIGVHTGPVIAGNVGSRKRFNYTVMGDAVNLASRLEHANNAYGTEIILSEATCRRLGEAFLVRELDTAQVRGRAQAVTIFELLGAMPPGGPPPWLPLFDEARAAYLDGKIPEAATRFQEILDSYRDDPPSEAYLKRCQKHFEKPQLSIWKGAFVLEGK